MQYGPWNVERSVGEGGQGHAFVVTHSSGKQKGEFVLKRLKDDRRKDRFKREVEAVRRLNHPNIVRVIDFNIDSTPYYYVMEYCEGGSLEKSLAIQFQRRHRQGCRHSRTDL